MRLIDDFLFVTKSPVAMRSFYFLLTDGIEEFKCFINPLKTYTNFIISRDDGEMRVCRIRES